MARDSVEGLDRFLSGVKPPDEFKHYGRGATTRVEVTQDGPMKGTWMKYTPSTTRQGDFDMEPLPQVGFATSEEGPHEYFPLDRLPERETLQAKGFKKGEPVFFRVWGTSKEEALAALQAKGYTWAADSDLPPSPPVNGRTKVDTVFRITHPEFRAVAKIGLGYLAHTTGAEVAALPAFHRVRRYVLHDERPPKRIVDIPRASEKSGMGHIVSVAQDSDGSVVACVTLFCRFLYVTRLSEGALGRQLDGAAHFFDLETRRAHRVV